MIDLKDSVKNINPYKVNKKDYKVKLDANEGCNYMLNSKLNLENFKPQLYPDSDANLLRKNMAKYYGCNKENILVGNGSSDLLLTTISSFCDTNEKVMTFEPSFSMYSIYCKISNLQHIKVKSKDNHSFSVDSIVRKYEENNPKVIIVCNPNNPTGSYLDKNQIKNILDQTKKSIVIIDEAYIEFGGESSVDLINNYENLIIMRTLSKAFGLAGLRIGALISNERMIDKLWKVKLPYNLNSASQFIANQAFKNLDIINQHIKMIIEERKRIIDLLKKLEFKVYPSMTNFIMIKSDIKDLAEKLEKKKVLIRDFTKDIEDHYRITIGRKEENDYMIKKLREVRNEERE